jgi:hypothetical protein
MSDIAETAILKRANEFCEQDGLVWEFIFKPEPNKPQRLASEWQRQQYLQRARAELCLG